MHYLWSVFSPVIFAAIGKQFLRVWGYKRVAFTGFPAWKTGSTLCKQLCYNVTVLQCYTVCYTVCKQLCKQIGDGGAPRQIISWTKQQQRSRTDINRRRSAVLAQSLILKPRVSTSPPHLFLQDPSSTAAWNNRRLLILRQITPLVHPPARWYIYMREAQEWKPHLCQLICRHGGEVCGHSGKSNYLKNSNQRKCEQKDKECEREGISCFGGSSCRCPQGTGLLPKEQINLNWKYNKIFSTFKN